MTSRQWAGVLGVLLLLQAGELLALQRVLNLPGAAACPNCRIEVTRVAVLGDTIKGVEALSTPFHRIDADSRGRYFVTSEAALIAIFDSTGRFVGNVGRMGDGPREYRFPRTLAIDRDSLFIADISAGRLTRVDLRAAPRTVPVSSLSPELTYGAFQGLRLGSGAIVVNMAVRSPDGAGLALHSFSTGGRKLKSFGSEVPAYRPDRPLLLMRRLAPSSTGGFWAAQVLAPRLEEYDRDGKLLRTVLLSLPWFHPGDGTERAPHPSGETPSPRIMAIREESPGLLWVAVSVADSQWRRAFRRTVHSSKSPDGWLYHVDDYNRLFDTILLAVDPGQGVVLAQSRFDEEIAWIERRTGLAAVTRVGGSGLTQLELWRLRLVR